MAIHIDIATAQRLIEARIETANDVTGPAMVRVLHLGEGAQAVGDGAVTATVAGFVVNRRPRRSVNEMPWADLEITIHVICAEAENQDSAMAITSAVESVTRVLECASLDDSATSGHIVELENVNIRADIGGNFQQVVQAEVVVFGTVSRVAGTSLEERH